MCKNFGFSVKALALAACLGTGSVLGQTQTEVINLVPNSGFEDGLYGWGFEHSWGPAGGTIDVDDPAAAHEGTKGAKVKVETIDSVNWHVQLQVPPGFEAVKDAVYKLSFWAKADAGQPGKPIHLAVQDGAPLHEHRAGHDYSLDTTWKKIEIQYTSDMEGMEALRFNIFVGIDTGTFYFDDFLLTATIPVGLAHPGARKGEIPVRGSREPALVDARGRALSGKSAGKKTPGTIRFAAPAPKE